MGKRKQPVILDIDEMINDPSQRGMLSFLDVHPDDKRRMLESRAIADRAGPIPFPSSRSTDGEATPTVSTGNESVPNKSLGIVSTATQGVHLDSLQAPPEVDDDSIPNVPIGKESIGNDSIPTHSLGIVRTSTAAAIESLNTRAAAIESVPLRFGQLATTRRRPFRPKLVQEAHTPAEDKVFFLMLNIAKDPKHRLGRLDRDGNSYCWASQPEIARRVRMHENNVRTILRSLTAKMSIQLVSEANRAEGKGRTWLIPPFKQILERRRAANLVWAIKSGGGQIRFVSPDQVAALYSEYEEYESIGNDSIPTDSPNIDNYVPKHSIPSTATDSISQMGTDSWSSKEVLVNNTRVNPTTPTGAPPAALLPLLLKAVGFAAGAGADFAQRLWTAAISARNDVQPEELARIVEQLWKSVSNIRSIDNPLGLVIRKTGPEVSARLDHVRSEIGMQREEEQRQRQQIIAMWTDILANPNDAELHEEARAALREYDVDLATTTNPGGA